MLGSRDHDVSRRVFLKTSGTATAIAGLAGCTGDGGGDGGDDGTPASDQKGGTLRLAQVESPIDFDPIRQVDGSSAVIHYRIFSRLYTFDEGTNLVPHVASDEPEVTREGTRWVIPLVDHAEWHNGDPITAEDVEYSLTQPVVEQRENMSKYEVIDDTEIIDETTLQLDLSEFDSRFRVNLQKHLAPKSIREEHKEPRPDDNATGGGWNENIVGSGPFELVEHQEGEQTRLEAVDDHWYKTSNLDEVIVEPITEPTTRATSLRTGDVDVIKEVPPQLWDTVQSMEDADVRSSPGLRYSYLAYNQKEGEAQNLEVRQGINQAFSVESAIERFVEPAGEPSYATLPVPVTESLGLPMDKYKDMAPGKDIDRAKELFEQAGVPDDWSPTIMVPKDQVRRDLATAIANGITEAGYDGQVESVDFGTFLQRYNTGNSDYYTAYIIGWTGAGHPMEYLYNLYHKDNYGTFAGTFYENEELMETIDAARTSTDQESNLERYDEIITTVLEDRVHTPLDTNRVAWGVKDYVKGFKVHPRGSYANPRLVTDYQNTWLDD